MASRPTKHVEALVLERTKLGEQDLIVTMLAKTGEQIRAVARSARKPGAKSAAASELFSEGSFLLASGKTLASVVECKVLEPHRKLRGHFERVVAGSALVDLTRLCCYEDAHDAFVYPCCARALSSLEAGEHQAAFDTTVAAYTFKLLAHLGWRPQLATCALCDDPDRSFFSAQAGGVICASCARELSDAESLLRSERSAIEYLLYSRFDALDEQPLSQDLAAICLSMSYSWALTHLETRIKAFEFLVSQTGLSENP